MAYDTSDFKGPGGVNVAVILALAEQVERSATLDMSEAIHPCGSAACIAGHAMTTKEARVAIEHGLHLGMRELIAARLGITLPQSQELFNPAIPGGVHWMAPPDTSRFISAAHAAACLRKLAATGVVDWPGTKPAQPTNPTAQGDEQ